MNTVAETNTTGSTPANPAKGNLRGQTTLAAELVRWLAMANKLGPQIDQFPGLKETFTQFQASLTQSIAMRDQIHTMLSETATAFAQRDLVDVDTAGLYSRLRLGLQAAHGPESPRLREFGLKPRKKTGRKPKDVPPLPPPPPPVEVAAPPRATAEPPAAAGHGE